MTITDDDKNKAKDFAAQLQSMAVWLTSLASSTEPGEVECVCVKDGSFCGKNLIDPALTCTRAKGHEGPCVACDGLRHDLTGALKREDESIDLGENNPDLRPDWWRELDEGEVIQKGDIVMYLGRFEFTVLEGEHYKPLVPGRKLHNPPHYRLRPWRDMEDGEVLRDRDEWHSTALGICRPTSNEGFTVKQSTQTEVASYRTRRPKPVEPPKEPELRLPDGTDISGWPVIESGEVVYPGDAVYSKDTGWQRWLISPMTLPPAFDAARRRVLPCRHCGGEAKFGALSKSWGCCDGPCYQKGPNNDPKAIGWNEQNRKSVERSEKEESK